MVVADETRRGGRSSVFELIEESLAAEDGHFFSQTRVKMKGLFLRRLGHSFEGGSGANSHIVLDKDEHFCCVLISVRTQTKTRYRLFTLLLGAEISISRASWIPH